MAMIRKGGGSPQARVLREKWASLEPCPYGCGGKLFGNVCSSDCVPSRLTYNCSDAFQENAGMSEQFPAQDQPRLALAG